MTAADVAWLGFGIVVLACASVAFWASRSGRRLRVRQVVAAERYLSQRDLPCEPELVVVAMRLQAAINQAGNRALAMALGVLGVAVALVPHLPDRRWLAAVGVPLLFLVTVVLFAQLSTRALRRHEPRARGPRVAHGARPRVTDYVAPLVAWWPVIAIAACGIAAGSYALDPSVRDAVPPGVVLVAWAGGSAAEAVILALAFWLAARPQPAATADELALRNELTSDLLTRLLLYPVLGFTLFYVGGEAVAFMVVGSLLAVVYLSAWNPHRQVRKRLFASRVRPPRPPLPLAGS